MHVVITGGGGFLGARLARTLLANGQLALQGAAPQTLQSITLVDRVAPPADLAADSRIQCSVYGGENLTSQDHRVPHTVRAGYLGLPDGGDVCSATVAVFA